jgi:hypothetical protein
MKAVGEAEHPDVDIMMGHANTVIDAKIAAAVASLASAQQSIMNLSMATAGANNTNKGMSAHDAVDLMMKANKEKAQAQVIKDKVKMMVESCHTLFSAVEAFKANTEPRAALQKKQTKATMESEIEKLKAATVATEKLDLANLLKIIENIKATQVKVEELDGKVGAGAAAGILGSTELVYKYGDQLEARKNSLTSADAFAAFPPLKPEDAKLQIEPKFAKSLDAAQKMIEKIIKEKNELVANSQKQMVVLSSSVNQANFTKMHGFVDDMMAANQAKALAEELSALIDTAIREIQNFFELFADYKSTQEAKKKIALGDVDDIIAHADALHKATDLSVLSEVGSFFHLYHLMWVSAIEAEDAMPDDDTDYTTIRSSLDENAIAVHVWLNGEMQSVCTTFKTCAAARKELNKVMSSKNATFCDERQGTIVSCLNDNDGHQPNGKMCKWIKGDHDKGEWSGCKQVSPPTNDLQYGRNHPDGAGIFY